MIDISKFMDVFLNKLKEGFGERIFFVGLQGSYRRGEATEKSDIDLVVILDELSSSDIEKYNLMLDTLEHREKLCGFLSGKRELFKWDSSDLFQLYYDTEPIYGTLDEIKPLIDEEALDRAIKIGACNIYHGCVHNMLYEKSGEMLGGLYKMAIFVITAKAFKKTGKYISAKDDLRQAVSPCERNIIDTFLSHKNGSGIDLCDKARELFEWVKEVIDN